MRKAKINPMDIYESERGSKAADGKAKDLLNLVVVGHVDSGKSTLMGHLLVELGQVILPPSVKKMYWHPTKPFSSGLLSIESYSYVLH